MIVLLDKNERNMRLDAAGITFSHSDVGGFEVWKYEGNPCLPPKTHGNTRFYCPVALNFFIERMTGKVRQYLKECGTVQYLVKDQ